MLHQSPNAAALTNLVTSPDKGEVYLLSNADGWSTATLQQFSIKFPASVIEAGKFHFLVLLRNGRVCSWGRGAATGHGGSASSIPAPKIIKAFRHHRIVQIAAGSVHSLFLTSEGMFFSCGLNFYGQLCLAIKPGEYKTVPTRVDVEALFVENERRRWIEAAAAAGGLTFHHPLTSSRAVEGGRDLYEALAKHAKHARVKAIAAKGDCSSVAFDDGTFFESMAQSQAAVVSSFL